MNPISAALSHVTLGLDTSVKGLSMFPLLAATEVEAAGEAASLDPLTLDEALSSGWARVTEVSDSGSVPELRFVNTANRVVFILDGEELVGARQNRIVNLSLLVPPSCTLTIPVSCVEAGRWHARSRAFSAAPRVQYAEGRARKTRQVTASMLRSGARCADQVAVWADISDKAARLRTASDTSAMEAMFVDHAASIDVFVEGLQPVTGQVGALFAVNGVIAGLDLFASPALLRKLLPKIVRSYALDAIDVDGASHSTSRERRRKRTESGLRAAAAHFVERCGSEPAKVLPAIGFGQDVRIDSRGVIAAGLVHDERLVHLSAFAA